MPAAASMLIRHPPTNVASANPAVAVPNGAAGGSAVLTFVILKIVDVAVGLRVTRDEETEGLDTALHGERIQ